EIVERLLAVADSRHGDALALQSDAEGLPKGEIIVHDQDFSPLRGASLRLRLAQIAAFTILAQGDAKNRPLKERRGEIRIELTSSAKPARLTIYVLYSMRDSFASTSLRLRAHRQPQSERGLVLPRRELDRSAVRPHDLPGDEETQSQARGPAGRVEARAAKRLEDLVAEIRPDRRAPVPGVDSRLPILGPGLPFDRVRRGAVLERVAQEVSEDLRQPIGVPLTAKLPVGDQPEPVGVLRLQLIDDRGADFPQVGGFRSQRDPP